MRTPFAHPARQPKSGPASQPVRARPSSNPSIFSAPSLLLCVLTSFPRCRFFLPALRLVGGPAVCWEVQPNLTISCHPQHLIVDGLRSSYLLPARCKCHSSSIIDI
jgi:hypothetical protein